MHAHVEQSVATPPGTTRTATADSTASTPIGTAASTPGRAFLPNGETAPAARGPLPPAGGELTEASQEGAGRLWWRGWRWGVRRCVVLDYQV